MPSLILPAAALACAAALLDWLYFGNSLLREDDPDLSVTGVARASVYLIAMLCFALGARSGRGRFLLSRTGISTYFPAAVFVSATLLWRSPRWFYILGLEDGLVEYLTAFCFLAAAGLAASAARNLRGGESLGAALFAFVSFVIAGEELSWGQRIFFIIPPEAFDGNAQMELNFHNFHTGLVEAWFYFLAGSVFFAGIPAAAHLPWLRPLWNIPVTAAFRPSDAMIPIGAAISVMNWDMWNAPLTQIGLWGSLCIVAVAARYSPPADRIRWLIAGFLCLAAQFVFLAAGHRQVRAWDITEYKELAIGAAFCVHAATVRATAKRTNPPAAGSLAYNSSDVLASPGGFEPPLSP